MSDDSKSSVFILASELGKLSPVIQYLQNRGWDVHWSGDIREALETILRLTPDYILISVEYPHPKVRSLPRIISQAVRSHVIPFAENATTLSFSLIQSMNLEYSVFPPISGPAVERTLLRIQRDEEERLKREQILNGDNKGTWTPEGKSDSHMVRGGGPNDSGSYHISGQGPGSKHSAEAGAPKIQGPSNAGSANSSESPRFIQKGANSNLGSHLPSSNSSNKAALDSSKPNSKTNSSANFVADAKKRKKAPTFEDTVLSRGTQSALVESANGLAKPNGEIESIETTSNVCCITVESPKFSGYLIAALGADRVYDEAFIETVRERLVEFLKSNGEAPTNKDTLKLKLRPVQFETWALDCAEFLRRSVHNGEEIAMAFFPRKDAVLELPESVHKDMLSLDIKNLEPDVPLEFNAYIYLPKNSKFILYTGKNRVLLGQQKDRLITKGVTHFYIHKDEAEGANQYWAQNYLNAIINGHEDSLDLPEEFDSEDATIQKKKPAA